MKKRWILLLTVFAIIFAASAMAQTGTTDTGGNTNTNVNRPVCSDYIDNDNDGLTDFPNDVGCLNDTDSNESNIVGPSAIDTTGIKVIKYSVSPTIDVVFSEFIRLDSVYLYAINDETTAMMALGINPPSIPVVTINDSNTISAKPLINLFNGLYELVLNVQDMVGNTATARQKFVIDVPVTDIDIVEPRLGVSNGAAADLVIETSRNGQPDNTICKITTSPFIYDFQSDALVPFDAVSQPRHNMSGFFNNAYFSDYAIFYILCNDTNSLKRVNRERFELYIDRSAPGISSFDFYPAKVVEYPEFENRMKVILNVTSNEPVICKYSNESKDYEAMTSFPGYDLNNFYAYTKNNNTIAYYLPDVSPASHDFYVQCEDRAGWRSPVVKKTLQVDLSSALDMTVVEPRQYTTNKSITMKMTTVKRAVCVIGNSTSDSKMMNTDTTGKTHSYYLGQFGDGSYTYKMKCTSQSVGGLYVQEQELMYTFTVDNTKPSAPNITGSKNTCFQTRFEFVPPITFTATDAESDIDYYLYKMDAAAKPILNWTRTNGDIGLVSKDYKDEDLNLSKAKSYKITAKAVNGAGLAGAEASVTITYNPDDVICFEKNPPVIVLAKNETEGNTIVEIACSDQSGCDNQSYYYGLCDVEGCSPTTKLDYPFMITVYDTKYLSYNVSDIHGYAATGTEKIEVKSGDTCGNMVKDGDETDVDCGGKCKGCEGGKSCIVNTDCGSNSCKDNICTEPRCDDNLTNGPYGNMETDVDCGGYCGATCGIDLTCNSNGDCLSGFCNPGKKCGIATCDDGYKNGNETGIDCGGDCGGDCNDKDGDGIDDLWEEKYCDGDCDPTEDLDGDGLNNLREFQLRTDPAKKDSDGDGYLDYEEIEAGTDPLDPDSYPKSAASILLILVGLIFMAGGAGYLVYKIYFVEKPMAEIAKPQTGKTPEQIAEERRVMEEQQRRMMEQRRKEAEERQKRYDEMKRRIEEKRQGEETKKKEERQSLFGKFGGMMSGNQQQKTERPETKIEKIEIKPKVDITAKAKTAVKTPEIGIRGKDDWLSVDKLKEDFGAIAHEAAKEKIKATEQRLAQVKDEEFGKLEEITKDKTRPKKEDIFKEMEKKIKGEDNGTSENDDIYKGLEEMGSKTKKQKR
ncbi:hypothetical protein COV19_06440 [Candidatus Woesearchaeota archaeon CG10_big_fil_rev_8_21_14_0_10_44_13]|nr:MAG: hypothetical protein COV19_06440 [Candidatus Woesearchaeota archaeon CG10_big_fil_rev_8_21_14_0_10_44_13]